MIYLTNGKKFEQYPTLAYMTRDGKTFKVYDHNDETDEIKLVEGVDPAKVEREAFEHEYSLIMDALENSGMKYTVYLTPDYIRDTDFTNKYCVCAPVLVAYPNTMQDFRLVYEFYHMYVGYIKANTHAEDQSDSMRRWDCTFASPEYEYTEENLSDKKINGLIIHLTFNDSPFGDTPLVAITTVEQYFALLSRRATRSDDAPDISASSDASEIDDNTTEKVYIDKMSSGSYCRWADGRTED